jgi:tripartite-type tricarboxylate transporter receptor subunit TctC
MMFDTVAVSLPNLKAGKLAALAVAAPERHFALPDVPTFAEKGYPAVESSTWTGLFAPKGTPPEVVRRLAAASAAALSDPEVDKSLRASGVQPRQMGGQQFAQFVDAEIGKWGKLVREAKITMD